MKIKKKPLKFDPNNDQTEEIISVFEENMKRIPKYVDNDYDENTNKQVLQASLDMVNDLIPFLEITLRRFKNERGAYAVNTLLNQQRELINDIRSLQTHEVRAERINDFVFESLKLIVENLFDTTSMLRTNLVAKLNPDNDPKTNSIITGVLERYVEEHGSYIVEMRKDLEEKIRGFVTKPPTISKQRKLLK